MTHFSSVSRAHDGGLPRQSAGKCSRI